MMEDFIRDYNQWNNNKKDCINLFFNMSDILLHDGYRLNASEILIYIVIKDSCKDNFKNRSLGFRSDFITKKSLFVENMGMVKRTFDRAMAQLAKLNLIGNFHRVSYKIIKDGKEVTMVKAFKNDRDAAVEFRVKTNGEHIDRVFRCYNPKGHGQKVVYAKLDGVL